MNTSLRVITDNIESSFYILIIEMYNISIF